MRTHIVALIPALTVGHFMVLAAQAPAGSAAGLIGTWRLVSAEQRMYDGTVRADPQTGSTGRGYLIYGDAGVVCTVLADPTRPRWGTAAVPTDSQLRTAYAGMVSYCGHFEIHESEGYVIHHVDVDRDPSAAGTDRKRFYTLRGDRLILRVAPPLPPGVEEWVVTWERVRG